MKKDSIKLKMDLVKLVITKPQIKRKFRCDLIKDRLRNTVINNVKITEVSIFINHDNSPIVMIALT